uniref:Sec1 family domain-containing protein 2 n=1 Tax=Strigamia maritima TaxID=126957 RepID=T1J9Z1_STRMM
MDVKFLSNKWWNTICKKLTGSIVFIDSSAAECLHWCGGLNRLWSAGANDVKEFSSFESGTSTQKKSVFILTKPIIDITETTLNDVIRNSNFEHCIILTTVHPSVQKFAIHDNDDIRSESEILQQIKDNIVRWMGNTSYIVEIECHPIFLASLCPVLFITPTFSRLFPTLTTDLDLPSLPRKASELELQNLPKNLMMELMVTFVHCFNNLLEELNVKEDFFTIGQFSKLIASQLDALPAAKTRRKSASSKISVLFIDRTLDLVGPTSHGIDTLMDRIMNMLPKLPNHSTDVAIDMYPLCAAPKLPDTELIAPGCLAPDINDTEGASVLNSLMLKKHKESLMEMNRHLVEAVTKEKLTSSKPLKVGRLNADTLENHLKLFKCKIEPISHHFGLLQQASAVIQSLKHSNNSHMDQLYGIEKGLLHSLEEEIVGANALAQIIQLIETRKDRSLNVNDILILLIHVYSLVVSDLEDEFYIEKLFSKLQDIGRARQDLKKYRLIFEPGGRAQPACYMPLLRQVVDDIFHPQRPEIPDIEYKSMGLRDMFKSGISLFLNVNKPQPSDNPMFLLFVVGGLTSSEVRLLKDTISARKPNLPVLIGTTHITKPEDILNHLLSPEYFSNLEDL